VVEGRFVELDEIDTATDSIPPKSGPTGPQHSTARIPSGIDQPPGITNRDLSKRSQNWVLTNGM
jgi:hypothetical protein